MKTAGEVKMISRSGSETVSLSMCFWKPFWALNKKNKKLRYIYIILQLKISS